ncbi:MAG: P-loop NTPase [Erysipelotrichaceae bacterium]|nr:P-loop NTPase [Erysipelotrichaceae bacterium]
MSEVCSHDCGSCSQDCASRQGIQKERTNSASNIKKIIGVVSGKGGVGKSLVSSLLAINVRRAGYRVGILDADITGPSIARIFGCSQPAVGQDGMIYPNQSMSGIDVMSINMMLEAEDRPVIWRGPVVAGIVKQFYTDVLWENIDVLFVDMPPGTGDVPLTVFQSLPVDGIVIVTSPQDLVSMIVAKAVNMAKEMNIPVLGVVENMSYLECPDCGKHISVFGESHLEETAGKYGLTILDRLPIRPEVAKACDTGTLEFVAMDLPVATKAVVDMIGTEPMIGDLRVAVCVEDGKVFQHFGKTRTFVVYDVEDGVITDVHELNANGQGHGALADVLAKDGVNVVICGGIGQGAVNALTQAGIQIVRGIEGDVDVVARQYVAGNIQDDCTKVCDHHDHEEGHDCGGHCCH